MTYLSKHRSSWIEEYKQQFCGINRYNQSNAESTRYLVDDMAARDGYGLAWDIVRDMANLVDTILNEPPSGAAP